MAPFLDGLTFWLRGWRYIMSRRTLLFGALVPFLLSLIGAATAVWAMTVYYPIWWASLGLSWSPWLALPLKWLGAVLLFILILYFTYALHTLIAQPFYSLLAERTLNLRSSLGWGAILRISVIKGFIFLLLGLILFVGSFVPGLNLLVIAVTLLILAFDCLDYSLEVRGLTLRQRFAFVLRNKRLWCGMAAGLALTLVIPGLTLLVIPGAVVGAALSLKEPNEPRNPSP